jgi:aldose 1-epimerase
MVEITVIGQAAGTGIHAITLSSSSGFRVKLMSYGARLAELWVPDRTGALADIVLGHDSLSDWQTQGGYLGATCGRYANRIAGGRFVLDGREVRLRQNEGAQHLHGGGEGFDTKVWAIESYSATHLTLSTTAPDGEMGYPGAVEARVTYQIDDMQLAITMTATTSAPTVVNMVNHSYFNLAGQASAHVLDQHLKIDANFYVPVDAQMIPTGEVLSVSGSALDFRVLRPIGTSMPVPDGFDHNLCLSAPLDTEGLRPCALAVDPVSGRTLRLSTSEPGVQLYTGAHFDRTPGKAGARYQRFAGFAIETQRFPDTPNNPHFPSARLDPGESYSHRMRFDFTPSRGA